MRSWRSSLLPSAICSRASSLLTRVCMSAFEFVSEGLARSDMRKMLVRKLDRWLLSAITANNLISLRYECFKRKPTINTQLRIFRRHLPPIKGQMRIVGNEVSSCAAVCPWSRHPRVNGSYISDLCNDVMVQRDPLQDEPKGCPGRATAMLANRVKVSIWGSSIKDSGSTCRHDKDERVGGIVVLNPNCPSNSQVAWWRRKDKYAK
ncbi:hypothetical protein EV424DRAFT_1558743 [Suillus variegatus]|nr:hypothetical protein EV424DRAFT_1558743 [Suillus variegatus]